MEFRYPSAVAETNAKSLKHLTEHLSKPEIGKAKFNELLKELGNTIDYYPEWHPVLTLPPNEGNNDAYALSELPTYKGIDHTVLFTQGFVTCPYNKDRANKLVNAVNEVMGLRAYHLDTPLYSDKAHPVVVTAYDIELEADGTIRSRDALAWCVQHLVKNARKAEVAETWWSMRSTILGRPHGSRSSLLVNQHTGGHMRKILEALNNSGMYGPVKEWSLEMLSQKKRKTISETLIQSAVKCWDKGKDSFTFELRGETCKAEVNDTWGDGYELSVSVVIGDYDLHARGFYYPKEDKLEVSDPTGKRKLAEKFL